MALEFNTTDNVISNGDGGIKVSPGNTEVVTVENGILIPDGTKTKPAVRFTDDDNTGIYSPVDDTTVITGHGEDVLLVEGTVSSVNKVKVKSSVSGQPVSVSADGTDTNIDLELTPKGTGAVKVAGVEVMLAGDSPSAHNHTKSEITDFVEGDYATSAQGVLADSALQNITGEVIDNLSDVDTSTASPTDTQVLTWVTANSKWEPKDAGGGGGASTLNDLTDVVLPSPPPASRYWRILITDGFHSTAGAGQIGELELRTSVGGADETGSGTASASDESGDVASKAFDNNTSTAWYCFDSSGGWPQWLQYDFGAGNEKVIVEYALNGPTGNQSLGLKAFELQYSSDGTNWTTISSDTSSGWTLNVQQVFSVTVGAENADLLTFDSSTNSWGPATNAATPKNWIDANLGIDFSVAPTTAAANSIVIGNSCYSSSTSQPDVVMGDNASSTSTSGGSVVLGQDANNTKASCIAIGRDAYTSQNFQIAIGYGADAGSYTGNIAIGRNATGGSHGNSSIAIGFAAIASSSAASAIGYIVNNSVADSFRAGVASSNILHLKDLGRLHLEGTQAQFVQPTYFSGSEPTGVAGGTIYDSTHLELKVHTGGDWIPVQHIPEYIIVTSTTSKIINGTDIIITLDNLQEDGVEIVSDVELIGNQLKLPKGYYEFEISAQLGATSGNYSKGKCYLYDTTAAAEIVNTDGYPGLELSSGEACPFSYSSHFELTAATQNIEIRVDRSGSESFYFGANESSTEPTFRLFIKKIR